jgi:acyl-CoA thioesterase I
MQLRRFVPSAQAACFALACSLFTASFVAPVRAADGGCPKTTHNLLSQSVELREVAFELREGRPVHILAIGSSSTQGIGASSRSAAYPARLEQDLRTLWNGAEVEVQNAGIGGETADQTVQRLEMELVARKPDLVIWQVGTNDAVRGGSQEIFRQLLRRGIAATRKAGADLILLDQQFYPAIKNLERYESFVSAVQETGERARVPVFTRYQLMKDWAADGPDTIKTMLSADEFHMSDLGYDCLASALGRSIALSLPAASVAKRPPNITTFTGTSRR